MNKKDIENINFKIKELNKIVKDIKSLASKYKDIDMKRGVLLTDLDYGIERIITWAEFVKNINRIYQENLTTVKDAIEIFKGL